MIFCGCHEEKVDAFVDDPVEKKVLGIEKLVKEYGNGLFD